MIAVGRWLLVVI